MPVIVWLRSRLPDSVPFLISLSPLTSFVAATAVPDAARTSAITAMTVAPDGLRPKIPLISYPSSVGGRHQQAPLLEMRLDNQPAAVNRLPAGSQPPQDVEAAGRTPRVHHRRSSLECAFPSRPARRPGPRTCRRHPARWPLHQVQARLAPAAARRGLRGFSFEPSSTASSSQSLTPNSAPPSPTGWGYGAVAPDIREAEAAVRSRASGGSTRPGRSCKQHWWFDLRGVRWVGPKRFF